MTPETEEISMQGAVAVGSGALSGFPPVLDACCASRKMWMDPKDKRAVFMDRRQEVYVKDKGTAGTIGRADVVVAPDVVADFTAMPFPDDTFWHVTFDPPHYTAASMTPQSCLAKCYGMLLPGWEEMLRAGFEECFRVLKPNGTLIFKWCATEIPLSHVLSLTPHKPLYGHRSGRKAMTHWMAFLKPNPKPTGARTSGSADR
jgi:SAM-dependent methyltransferase